MLSSLQWCFEFAVTSVWPRTWPLAPLEIVVEGELEWAALFDRGDHGVDLWLGSGIAGGEVLPVGHGHRSGGATEREPDDLVVAVSAQE